MCNGKDLFNELWASRESSSVSVGNEELAELKSQGSEMAEVSVSIIGRNAELKEVVYVLDLVSNLLLVSGVRKANLKILLD